MNFDFEKIIRENIRRMQAYSSAREEYKQLAKAYLDANESPFENGVNRYPDPYQTSLKKKIANMKGIPAENMILGNGSDEIIDLIVRACCEPQKDNIVTISPTYGMYKVIAELNNVAFKSVRLDPGFLLNAKRVLSTIDRHTKIVFLCSPNNPSGNLLCNNAIEDILHAVNIPVVVDEAYIDFADRESWVSRLAEFPNLIICQTLSKAWGMAGIRLGIGIASAQIIQFLTKIKPPYNINLLTQQKAMELLDNESAFRKQLNLIKKEKKRLADALNELSSVETTYPSDANFLLVKFKRASYVYDQLLQEGIVVRNRSNEPLCDSCLRITVGLRKENNLLINTLKIL